MNYRIAHGVVVVDTLGPDVTTPALPHAGDPSSLLALGGLGLASLVAGSLGRRWKK